MRFRSLASKWLNIKVYPLMLRDNETKDLQFHSWAHKFRRQYQGWNVLASHLASLASFKVELSDHLANKGESNIVYYLQFQHTLKAPPAAGLRAPWGVYGLQAGLTTWPFPETCQKMSVPIEFTWLADAVTPFTGCSAHHPQLGLERSSFAMISQATLEDNAGIAGSISVPLDFLVTIYTQRKLIRYQKCSGRKLGHIYFCYQVHEKIHKNCT